MIRPLNIFCRKMIYRFFYLTESTKDITSTSSIHSNRVVPMNNNED